MLFTGRFAIAPSHLKKSFYRQSCNGIFSPWIFFLLIWHGAFSPANFFTCRFGMAPSRAAKCTEKQKWSSQNSNPNWNHRNNHEICFGPNQNIIFHPKHPNFAENHEIVWKSPEKKNRNALQPNCTTINAIIVTNTTKYGSISIEVALCTTNHHAKTQKGHKRPQKATKGHHGYKSHHGMTSISTKSLLENKEVTKNKMINRIPIHFTMRPSHAQSQNHLQKEWSNSPKAHTWSMAFCCSGFNVQMHKPLLHDSPRFLARHHLGRS